MNPTIFANPRRTSLFVRELPFVEPAYGKHASVLLPEQLEQQRTEYLTANRQVLPGFGKHRLTRNDYVLAAGKAS